MARALLIGTSASTRTCTKTRLRAPGRFGIILTIAITFLSLVLAQTSTVNGVAEYRGTPVATHPYGIPTLVYNCAKLPAICQNVNTRNRLQNVVGIGGLGLGKLVGNAYIELNYDTNQARKDERRLSVCPQSWRITHPCPETNQPNTVPADTSLGQGSWPVARFNPQNLRPVDSGYNTIANGNGGNSGLIWTCDEWPPSHVRSSPVWGGTHQLTRTSTVEGGLSNQANTICAPQNANCGRASTGVAGVRSEQDFQAAAHASLRSHVVDPANPSGIFTFHFQTGWEDDQDAPATYVEWYDSVGGERLTIFSKRSIGPTHLVVDEFYSNGTTRTVRRELTEAERSTWWKRGDGGNATVRAPEQPLSLNATTQPFLELPSGGGMSGPSPVHQSLGMLPEAPPLPIVDLSRIFVQKQARLPVDSYMEQTLGSTSDDGVTISNPLTKRQNQGDCGRGSPCPDGSCCNNNGNCGFGPENCGARNCISKCDATALCGKDSKGGAVKCPLNVCCSTLGYCGTDADFCTPRNQQARSQEGFGSCQVVQPPSCGGCSASGRTIGYYQVENTRERQCNRITPAQIDTKGLTHPNLAFATIDPVSFAVMPMNPADVDLYARFTALKSSSLQTWIAIGGWAFSDPGRTRTTWSDLASTRRNRAAFISSLRDFTDRHGFQGVDLDWEYPGAPDRSGKTEDTQNLVDLVREMRAAFDSRYGISLALPASYWYLRWFKPKETEPYVDFFGLMTYDLHDPWDAGVKQIGRIVYGQTNIPEISNWTLPLWYDKVDPSKINLGLAYYGRGYTLADQNCNRVGCA